MAVTLRDVAKLAGTSVAAASHTLNGRRSGSIRVGAETKDRILKAAEQLGYQANPIARSLATGKSHSIGLVLPYPDAIIDQNPFCTHVTHAIFERAIENEYNVMIFAAGVHGHEAVSRVDGLIFVLPARYSPLLNDCVRRGLPCVAAVATPVPNVHTINVDDESGAYLATRHLIDLGHTRIGLLEGCPTVCTSRVRTAGYLQALRDAGISRDDRLIVKSGFDARFGYEAMNELLQTIGEDRPTAVFACNDLCAAGAISAIREAGLSIPDDIAVIGYDDTEFCETTRPTLTSINMRLDQLGHAAFDRLIDVMEGNPIDEMDVLLPVSLTIRQSCGAPAGMPPVLQEEDALVEISARSLR
jgi:LacI family transcriptional regulator